MTIFYKKILSTCSRRQLWGNHFDLAAIKSLIILVTLATAQPALAAPDIFHASSATTPELIESCSKSSNVLQADFCTGYILGAFDQLSLSKAVCPKDGFSTLQAVGVARKFLTDHPERWHELPLTLIGTALKNAFPCSAP